jgi:hypothetical protein
MTKRPSIVDLIAASIPESQSGKPWWLRLTPDQQELVDPVLAAWKAGRFGRAKITAARVISSVLTERGIKIGPQGVLSWLQRSA